jgi:hypothetical protein
MALRGFAILKLQIGDCGLQIEVPESSFVMG